MKREKLIAQYEDKVYECVSATVQKVEPATLNAILTIDKNEVYLVRSEQIPGEVLRAGDNIQVYVVGIANPEKKPTIKISRTHRELVKKDFSRGKFLKLQTAQLKSRAFHVLQASEVKLQLQAKTKTLMQ